MTTQLQVKRPKEYLEAIQEIVKLTNKYKVDAANIRDKIYRLGKKYGLDNDQIREDIHKALVEPGIIGERQLRNLLEPYPELKHTEKIRKPKSAETLPQNTVIETPQPTKSFEQVRDDVIDSLITHPNESSNETILESHIYKLECEIEKLKEQLKEANSQLEASRGRNKMLMSVIHSIQENPKEWIEDQSKINAMVQEIGKKNRDD